MQSGILYLKLTVVLGKGGKVLRLKFKVPSLKFQRSILISQRSVPSAQFPVLSSHHLTAFLWGVKKPNEK